MAKVLRVKGIPHGLARQVKRLLISNRRGATLRIEEVLKPFKNGNGNGHKNGKASRRPATNRVTMFGRN